MVFYNYFSIGRPYIEYLKLFQSKIIQFILFHTWWLNTFTFTRTNKNINYFSKNVTMQCVAFDRPILNVRFNVNDAIFSNLIEKKYESYTELGI